MKNEIAQALEGKTPKGTLQSNHPLNASLSLDLYTNGNEVSISSNYTFYSTSWECLIENCKVIKQLISKTEPLLENKRHLKH